MKQSNITIDVLLDNDRVPEAINWKASDSTADMTQKAKAMMLAFWDSADKSALRIDLWTKDMMVDEMGDFFYQTFITMADTYSRATKHKELVDEIKQFAETFKEKFKKHQLKDYKA
jgi:gliding motility-associated protein GldC